MNAWESAGLAVGIVMFLAFYCMACNAFWRHVFTGQWTWYWYLLIFLSPCVGGAFIGWWMERHT